uniref:Chromosome X open reading frame 66 n=1 Tax=Prolemur simus TaxID=1328070 RepID=A0A8C9DSN2_PROSS
MNLFICILLLSIWTYNCLNTNQSDVSTTTGAKPLESMETKMDSFRRRLLIIVTGVMIVAFVSMCFCFLHFNCMSDDAPIAGMVKKEGVASKKSRSSKMSFSESKTASLCSPEKQAMLSTVDRLSRPLSAEKSSISSSTEKLVSSSSPKKPSKPSGSKKLFKSYRKCSPKKSRKLSHAPKLVNPFNAGKPASLLQPSKTPSPPYPRNQILPPKPSRLQKLAKPPRRLKRSVNVGKATLLSRPQLANTCQCCEKRRLVCKTFSEPLVNDISEAKKKQARNLPISSKVKSFPGCFHKVDSRDNTYRGNMSDSDMMTYNSDDDSDREITIICNVRQNEAVFKGTPNN